MSNNRQSSVTQAASATAVSAYPHLWAASSQRLKAIWYLCIYWLFSWELCVTSVKLEPWNLIFILPSLFHCEIVGFIWCFCYGVILPVDQSGVWCFKLWIIIFICRMCLIILTLCHNEVCWVLVSCVNSAFAHKLLLSSASSSSLAS